MDPLRSLPAAPARAALLAALLATHAALFAWLARIWWDLGLAVASLSIFITPVIAGLLYLRRRELAPLRALANAPTPAGLAMMAASALGALTASALGWTFALGLTLPLGLHGYLVWTRGHDAIRAVVVPVYLLLFLVPWSYGELSLLSEPLQVASAQLATWFLQAAGFPSALHGTVIHTGITLNYVNEACSGVATLSALILYAFVFAYIFRLKPSQAAVIALTLFPGALLANALRVAFISYLLYVHGQEVANGPLHDLSGHVVFALIYLSLFAVMRLLKNRENAQMLAASTTHARPST